MIFTAILGTIVGLAYVGLGTVRFTVASESVLRYAYHLNIPRDLPDWFPDFIRVWFASIFRMSARLFFLGCAYVHFEIAAHAFVGDLPPDYGTLSHQLPMIAQAIGSWIFVAVLSIVDNELRKV